MRYLTEGLHPDVPMVAYVQDPCPEPSVSKSVLKNFATRSAQHVRMTHPRLSTVESDSSARADIGSAVHALALCGPDEIAIQWVEADDWRTKIARELRDAAYAAGQIPMLEKYREPVQAAADAAKRTLAGIGQGLCEQTMIWRDNGIWCRARPDWMSQDKRLIVDLKTCSNADPATWARSSLFAGGYDLQAVHYLSGLRHLCGDEPREFWFLAQEIEPPYGNALVALSGEALALAERKRVYGMQRWRECLASNTWPGYGLGVYYVDAPAYQAYEWAAREGADI